MYLIRGLDDHLALGLAPLLEEVVLAEEVLLRPRAQRPLGVDERVALDELNHLQGLKQSYLTIRDFYMIR